MDTLNQKACTPQSVQHLVYLLTCFIQSLVSPVAVVVNHLKDGEGWTANRLSDGTHEVLNVGDYGTYLCTRMKCAVSAEESVMYLVRITGPGSGRYLRL